MSYQDILTATGFDIDTLAAGDLPVHTPVDGSTIARVASTPAAALATIVDRGFDAFLAWRTVPPPRRGELVRLLGDELRNAREDLGRLVSLESGKILAEGIGEVQEMIDICDYATGLSRQLHGLVIASERPGHRMLETWHPLGVTAIITAFNFPVAVWSWNAALALVSGDSIIWKPSERTPLTALACERILQRAIERLGDAPPYLQQTVIGDRELATHLVANPRVALVSATGSTGMGRAVAPVVAARFGRCILELGGNNAMIVAPSADLELALRAIVFSAVGTAGQRCTTLRRLIVHDDIYETLLPRLKQAYDAVAIGNPLGQDVLMGPLINEHAYACMQQALTAAVAEGGVVSGGQRVELPRHPGGYYVRPAIVEMPAQTGLVRSETFAPILYVLRYRDLDEAIALQNDVPQGLSSSIFSNDIRETGRFLSAAGSDCGIANVNIGPSGAEIGGAFGGEKETGGGRESGSDAWKGYMRRATNTINYSTELPLAQGINFDFE